MISTQNWTTLGLVDKPQAQAEARSKASGLNVRYRCYRAGKAAIYSDTFSNRFSEYGINAVLGSMPAHTYYCQLQTLHDRTVLRAGEKSIQQWPAEQLTKGESSEDGTKRDT